MCLDGFGIVGYSRQGLALWTELVGALSEKLALGAFGCQDPVLMSARKKGVNWHKSGNGKLDYYRGGVFTRVGMSRISAGRAPSRGLPPLARGAVPGPPGRNCL